MIRNIYLKFLYVVRLASKRRLRLAPRLQRPWRLGEPLASDNYGRKLEVIINLVKPSRDISKSSVIKVHVLDRSFWEFFTNLKLVMVYESVGYGV